MSYAYSYGNALPPAFPGASAPNSIKQASENKADEPRRSRIIPDLYEPPSQDKEMRLVVTREDRFKYDNLADLYSIVVACEHLETAYVRDSVSAAEYAPACAKLIAQFKTLKETVSGFAPDVEAFMKQYNVQCPAAKYRLLQVGVPATVEHGGAAGHRGKGKELHVAETVQHFITTMDSLKLDMRAVDEIHPHLNDLMESLNKVPDVLPDHASKIKVKEWLVSLNSMRASDELSDDQARQMLFDLDIAYNEFVRVLQR